MDLVTKVEAVLYLKGRPITKKDLSEITNSDINSIAELGWEYLLFRSLIASFIELISELVISERSFFVIGLPFKYRTASILVTRSISDNAFLFRSDWLIFITEIFPNLP